MSCLIAKSLGSPFRQEESKIHSRILSNATSTNILVNMKHCSRKALAEIAHHLEDLEHHEKAQHVYHHLQAHATASQSNVHRVLSTKSSHYTGNVRVLWITNQVAVEGASRELIEALAALTEVEMIHEDAMVALEMTQQDTPDTSSIPTPWSLDKLGTSTVWAAGNHGEGTIAGFIDSGHLPTHQEFAGKHVLAWRDVVNQKTEVYDDLYHGTHVTATAVGANIGIASAADIVACKAFRADGMIASQVSECAQFMICPNGNCAHTPHVINNSWTFWSAWDNSFEKFTEAWHKAGIVGVFCTGNNFQAQTCADLVTKPPAVFSNVISVGATDEQDKLGKFSRQGSQEFKTKPDLTAPGVGIDSASNTGNGLYASRTGTSMSAPQVTGAVLLIIAEAKRINLSLTPEQIRDILTSSAIEELQTPELACNYEPVFPNLAYGAGRLNIAGAIERVRAMAN